MWIYSFAKSTIFKNLCSWSPFPVRDVTQYIEDKIGVI